MVKIVIALSLLGVLVTFLTQTTWVSEQLQERVVDMHADADWAPRVEYQLGLYCFYLNDGVHAREIFQRVLDNYGESEYLPLATYRIAQTHDDQGNRAMAIMWFRKAAEALPEGDPWREEAERKVRAYTTL